MRLALSFIYGDTASAGALEELVAETALADARLADYADHHTAAAACLLERSIERRQLVPAPHEPREAARAGNVKARVRATGSREGVDMNGLADAFDVELAEVVEIEIAGNEVCCVLREVRLARLGEGLHPLRQADRVADGGVFQAQIVADLPHDHLARVDADPYREVQPVAAAHL